MTIIILAGACHRDSPDSQSVAVQQQPGIGMVVKLWREGATDDAVALLMEAAQDDANWTQRLCAFDLSEAEYVQLHESVGPHVGNDFLAVSRNLRIMCGEILEISREAMADGDLEAARELIAAVKRCGIANTGPDMVKVGDITGKAILKIAAEAEAELARLTDQE